MPEQSNPRQKFRSSCTNCANAKVKCDATRPECGRCQERGLSCLYAPSNRYGRRPAFTANEAHGVATDNLPSPRIECCVNPCIYEPIFAHVDVNDCLPQVEAICGALERDVPVDQIHHLPQLLPAGSSEWCLHNLGLANPSGSHEREPQITTSQPLSPPSSLFTHCPPSESGNPPENSHNCLSRAARILVEARCSNNANPTGSIVSARAGGSNADNSRDAELLIGDVIFTNRRILDQVTKILDCHCAGWDYQTLLIICMIWFHLIDKYAAAVAAATGSINRQSHRLTGSVQILLGELRQFSPLIQKIILLVEEARTGPRSAIIGVSISVFYHLQGDLARNLHHLSTRAEQILQHLSI